MRTIIALLKRNLLKLVRNRMRLFMNLFMSAIFLFIFSFIMKSTGTRLENPMNYLIAGIIIMTVFQSAMNNSMNILDDITGGFMKEILVAPVPRWQIAIGHVLSATVISVIQGIIIVIIGLFMGFTLDFQSGIGMLIVMILVGLTFSSMGLFLATITRESTNFQLLVTIVSFPLTFLSGAYIPTMVLPKILLPIVYVNPLTYATALFRYVTLKMENVPVDQLVGEGVAFQINGWIISPWLSSIFIMIICAVFFFLCVNRFSRADFSNIKTFRHKH
jgi:ABC-2 type transport system permease protein